VTFAATPADPAAAARVLHEARVDTAIDPPSWTGYVEALLESLVDRLSGYGLPLRDFLQSYSGLPRLVTYGLLAVVVLLAALVVIAFLQQRARGLGRAGAARTVTSRPRAAARDAAFWRAEAERRLARGALGPALEALWWWFALSAARDVPESCTSRELIVRARRPDLAAPARELDRLLYGPQRPQADDVRALAERLSQVLA